MTFGRWKLIMEKSLVYCARMAVGCLAAALAISPAVGAERLKVTLNWTPDNSSIGIIYADALGYYKQLGIELEIEPGKGSGTSSQMVAAGSTDVGLVNAPSAIALAAKGAPLKIIAPIYQASELGIISLEDTAISRPKELEGKTIALPPGAAQSALFDVLVKQKRVDKSKVQILSADPSSYIGLLAERKVDGVSEAPAAVMIPLGERDVKTKTMFYKDNGAPILSTSLVARDDKLKSNPELYMKFVDATLRGYSAVAKDPEAAVEALRSRYPDEADKKEVLLKELRQYLLADLCVPGASGLGKPPAKAWATTGEILASTLGSLGDGGIDTKYTERYLPREVPPCP
ncbi:hypothetical protein AU467_31650 [Mesorhizobium loti]|uniref:Thiamine pyrimidine synthase n=1 Tax=Rhizobium loti TaxID=381 RepID=A0A101KNH5_RHILI|nr:hypothetical protein AU467_31650 [Mesorhizobium loti]